MRVLKNDTFFLITFRSVSFTLSLLFREERPVHETRMHGERRSEREGGRGKGKGRGRGRGKGKEWRVRGVERVGWLGIYDVPVHESDEGAKKRKDGGGGNKGRKGG